jgi:F-type H+-transporting ATPase subunit delta
MSESKVAARYAKALLDLALEQNQLDAIAGNMKDFLDTIRKNPQLDVLLKSPVITGDHKMAVVKRVFEKSYHKNTIAFFDILIRKNRSYYVKGAVQAFMHLYKIHNKIITASIKTAQPINDNLTNEVKQFIEKYSGKKVELTSSIDPRLIGGLVIQMEDKLFDASISGKLSKVKHDLLNSYISK